MDQKLSRGTVKYQPTDMPVKDERQQVRGAKARIEAADQILETTVIPPEGAGPESWIGEAQRVEELYERGLITIKLALVEAANEGARGKSGTLELGPRVAPEVKEHGADVQTSRPRPLSVEHLARLRAEAAALDARVPRDAARRATAAVMDASVVLELLDEVDRLRRELCVHADDGSTKAGPIPPATLERWRADAEREPVDSDAWTFADRLLSAIDELERRRQGAAAALGGMPKE